MVVSSCSIFQALASSAETSTMRAGFPSSSIFWASASNRSCCCASLSLPFSLRTRFARRFSMLSRSASISSVSMVSASAIGSMRPSTWVMSSSSKQRSTCAIASVSRILARNWLPSPSPFDAPFTSPAISTKVMRAGMICLDPAMAASLSRRGSGTATSPTLGSMVQNGKLAACAAAVLVNALNRVDLPTFGSPTIPILKPIWPSASSCVGAFYAQGVHTATESSPWRRRFPVWKSVQNPRRILAARLPLRAQPFSASENGPKSASDFARAKQSVWPLISGPTFAKPSRTEDEEPP